MLTEARLDPSADFIERMGLLLEADGLPRIAGRLFGLFLLEGGPFGLKELGLRLGVSRASVSTNLRLLASHGLLERVARPGDRQDYYLLAPDPYASLLRRVQERLNHARDVVADSRRKLGEAHLGAAARLEQLAEFYAASAIALAGLVEQFDRRHSD